MIRSTRVRNALTGAFGGGLGWLITEVFANPDRLYGNLTELFLRDALFGAINGVCIGLALGLILSLGMGTQRLLRSVLIGAGIGLLGGAIGLMVGEALYQPTAHIPLCGRGLGWGVFGAVLGASQGITRRSWLGLRNAGLGGLIGGLLGGFLFDLVGLTIGLLTASGAASRAVALTILGACIGLFIAVMQRVLSDGWLKVTSGRFEGREFYLDKPVVTVGCGDRCDVVLPGDPQILVHHATMQQEQGVYVLTPQAGATVLVNRQPVTRHVLQHEDELRLGNTRLFYRSRKAAATAASAPLPVLREPADWSRPDTLPASPQSRPAVRYCRHCGAPNRPGARFCARCGSQMGAS